MINIALHGAEFFAHHGFYAEEQKLGCRFVVDIDAAFIPPAGLNDSLEDTVDYEKIYIIACEEMKHPRKLIETVAQSIADAIMGKYPFIKNLRVAIKKINPPLAGKVGYSSVIINYPPVNEL